MYVVWAIRQNGTWQERFFGDFVECEDYLAYLEYNFPWAIFSILPLEVGEPEPMPIPLLAS